jgi:tetratricopeptide (TPR) repeat protein
VSHEESAADPKDPAASLLAAARSLRQQQRWADAAEKYRYIQQEFSDSPEAHAVRVSLGDLQPSRLGQPDRALQSFDAYLVRSGPLAVEARLGRIRALRALGATRREAEAIREFLRLHPRSLEVSPLTERLDSLTQD